MRHNSILITFLLVACTTVPEIHTGTVPPEEPSTLQSGSIIPFPLSVLPPTVGVTFTQSFPNETSWSDCQPAFFDPAVTPYHLTQSIGSPAELYSIGDDPSPIMMIDGWEKEGEDKIHLQKPLDMTVYRFGCTSTFSAVIEVKKDHQRHILFTHVDGDWQLSPNQQRIALRDAVQQLNGTWQKGLRIVTLATKEEVRIPHEDCTTHIAGWSEGKLITTSDVQAASELDTPPASICVWDLQGTLLGKIQAEGLATGGNSSFPINRIGLIPREQNALFVLLGGEQSYPSIGCRLVAIDLQDARRTAVIDFPLQAESYFCASGPDEIELDVSSFTWTDPKFRFRVWRPQQDQSDIRIPDDWEENGANPS